MSACKKQEMTARLRDNSAPANNR